MPKFILKNSPIFLPFLTVIIFFFGEAKAQAPIYLNGQITGSKVQAGSLIGLGYGNAGLSAPMLTEAWGCGLLGAQTNEFRFYYSTLANFLSVGSTSLRAARSFGLAGLLGSGGDVYVQFRNTANASIPAGTPIYFKLNERPTNSGISINVGGLLGLAELNSITGQAYSGATDYKLNTATTNIACSNPYNGLENSGSVAGTSTTELLIDATGNWYAKVTPSASYNAVRLNVAYPTGLLPVNILALANINAAINVNVYGAFTQTNGGACNLSPQFTSPGEVLGGITLTPAAVTAGLGINLNELVANPQLAINGNPSDYASFSSGVANVGVANSIAQRFHFDHPATANDGIRVQLGIEQSLIDLDLLKLASVRFKAYNGATQVYNESLVSIATLLQLNLLNLVTINATTHKRLDLTFKPGVVFDRFEIIFDQGLASVGILGDALRIYEVGMAPSLPTITLQPTTVNATSICEGGTASFNVAATASAGGVITAYQWQYLDASNNWVNAPLGTSSTLTLSSVTNAMNNRLYRAKITGGNTSCPQDVFSNEAKLTVNPRALAGDVIATNAIICEGVSVTLTASSITISNPSYKWYDTINLTGIPLSITNELTISPLITKSYWVSVEGTGKCENAPNTARQVTVTVNPLLPVPAITVH